MFVVATANDIAALPPELVRKGRFDEIFFVDLPEHAPCATRSCASTPSKRIAAARRRRTCTQLAALCDGFSGAEIEQAVVSAVYAAHAADARWALQHILREIKATRPLSVVMAERIASCARGLPSERSRRLRLGSSKPRSSTIGCWASQTAT